MLTKDKEYDKEWKHDNQPGSINHNSIYECLIALQSKKLIIPLKIGNMTSTGLIDCRVSIILVRLEFATRTNRDSSCAVRYDNGTRKILNQRTQLRITIDNIVYYVLA
eukprot:TRINITY_DN5497_c0_g1_i5.p2 TRINITY_DN5497_c0_g1~~TRINITY_DN5497_c0_g1_i5.p2  ORF type:complete len:108 (-),score=4.98 TRINITY_DN5497_c0_g1_i5:1725-2048(-)